MTCYCRLVWVRVGATTWAIGGQGMALRGDMLLPANVNSCWRGDVGNGLT